MTVFGFNAFRRRQGMAQCFLSRRCEEETRVAVWVCCEEDRRLAVWKGSCNFFMWCDDFLALGRSCNAKCECNRDEVMQKLVEENEILRK
ncbi:hypothetical protein Taro_020495 [Colocasia esculenta]|uniref:Uncharacterized protein n=1 Tax=Colocasia esculenta TaxID=4460 RepID=A0A843UWJ7_COLES|nr:hypothetical protein [Colocasia esculenta]